MPVSRSQKLAVMKYREKTYERLVVDLKKGKRDYYKQEAARRGLSLSMLVQKSIEEYLQNHAPTNN